MEYKCTWCGFVDHGKTMIVDKDCPYLWVCPKCSQFTNFGTQLMDTIKPPSDTINAPRHYFFGSYQVRDVLQAWLKDCGLSCDEASDWEKMMEYLFRYHKKGKGQDLDKAGFYLKKIRERYDD